MLVATGHEDEGVLAFYDDHLIAVLVKLAANNEAAPGQWFLEYGFEAPGATSHPLFDDLAAAEVWLLKQLPRKWAGRQS